MTITASIPIARMPLTVLTQSSLSTYRRCPRQYYYRYELLLDRERTNEPLRLGSAFHLGQEFRHLGEREAIDRASANYDQRPAWADPLEWAVERETVRALLAGYFWRYAADTFDVVATEGRWQIPLENPETGAISRTYCLAGKIDRIVSVPADGRSKLAILEYKTTGEAIDAEADYWQRLRADAQISAYVYAARKRGYHVETVLYDVTRRPEISPRQVPVLDESGFKIVTDEAGTRIYNKPAKGQTQGKPRESASTENGWTMMTTRETPEDFGKRLLADIGDRPDFYFARREITRLDSDLVEFSEECWQQSQQLHQARRRGLWFRNVSLHTCRNCTFKEICLQNIDPIPAPSGFVVRNEMHVELTGEAI